jgi:PilZ domain
MNGSSILARTLPLWKRSPATSFSRRKETCNARRNGQSARGARFAPSLAAEVIEVANGAKLNVRTSDVSRTGCYIDTQNPMGAGSAISVRLQHKSETFIADGRVAYVSPRLGMGVAFDNIEPDQFARLDRWLAEAAGTGKIAP